ALLLVGAVVLALPPTCIGQADTTPAPTDSTTRPTHSYFIDAARLTREEAVGDVGELLMDRVPGLLVVPGSGLTGTGSRIRLRGVQSLLDDRAPLVLVDGMRLDQAEDEDRKEHTSELQSRGHLVCRLLLEKKKTNN